MKDSILRLENLFKVRCPRENKLSAVEVLLCFFKIYITVNSRQNDMGGCLNEFL